MAKNEKQTANEKKYVDKMGKWSEAYKARVNFISSFKLDPVKTKSGYDGMVVMTSGATTTATGSAEKKDESNAAADGQIGSGGSAEAQTLLKEALRWVGKVKYVFGARRPDQGRSDCSGYVQYVFKQALNMNVGPTTLAQIKYGKSITKEERLPGDIIFFQGTYRPGVSHVGIVINKDQFVHCGTSKGVGINNFTDSYFVKHFMCYRRFLANNGNSSSAPKADAKAMIKELRIMEEEAETIPFELSELYGVDLETIPLEGIATDVGCPYYEAPSVAALMGYTPLDTVTIDTTAMHFQAPTMNRAAFLERRIRWAQQNKYANFESLNSEQFVHLDRHDGFEGNLYSPDAKLAFEILRLKSKRQKLEILSGFRFSPEGLWSPHEAGIAMDIKVYGKEDARKLADVAWACGFRSIAIGGDLDKGTGFLHLDIGPRNEWGYDEVPVYSSPGRWS